jgi:tetratricopeptide (TPR) repeat protein
VTAYFLQDQDVEVISLQSRQESLATIDTCMQNYHEFCESTSDKRKFGGLVEGLQTTFATFYGRHDRYDDAEKLFLESLEWQKRELGQLNLSTLRTANNLAAMYLDQRQLEKAETLLIQTVALKETLLGRDNPITLNTVNNLGNLYAMQSFFDQAQQMYTRTLETYSAIYGETHKTVLEAQNNLGEVAMKMGHFQKAETWFKTALAPLRGSKETGLTLYIKSNIAVIYKLQGRHSDAIALYEEVIRGRETLLGPDHSSTLISMCELGDVYVACGQREKADEWYSRGKADKSRRNKGILEVKTSDERPAPGIATTLSHDLVSQGATSETAPSYDRIKWDGPEKPQSEIARSGRTLQNRLAQQTFRKRMRQKRSGWASMNDGILTPEQKQLLMTRSMASEPLINLKTRESFTGPATDFSEEDFWAFPEGSTLDSESVEASKDLVHDNQDSNSLPQRFHRLHIYNPDVDDDMPARQDENSEQISRLEPTLEPSGDTPDRRGRARRNKMLALSRMSRIFLDAQKETPEQSNILPKTTLPDPTVPAEAQSRSFTHTSPRSNLGQNQAGPIDERQVPSRSGSRHANQWLFSSLSIRAAVEALPKRHGDEGTTMGLEITANRPMDVDRLDVNMNNPQNSFNRQGLNVTNWPISDAEDFEMLDKTLGIPRSRPNFASNYENNVSGSSREALPVMTYLNSPLRPEQPREFLPTSSDEAPPSKDPVQSEETITLQRPPSPLGSVAPVVRDAKGQIDVLDRSGLMRENVTRVISRPPNYGSDRFHKMSSWNDIPEGIVKPPNWDLEVINPSKSKLPPPTLSTTGGSNQSNIPTDIRSALLTDADQGGANQLNPTAPVAPPPTKNPGAGSINPYAPDIQRVPDTSALQQGSRSETRWKAGRRTRADDVIPWEYSR